MQAFTIIQAGSLDGAVAPDGAILRIHDDGATYRNGDRWVVKGISVAAARLGVYATRVFIRGKTDGKFYLITPTSGTGFQEITDPSTLDPAFVQLMTSAANEPT